MARLSRRFAATVTAIVAVVTLVGCGGGTSTKDKNAYAREVNAAQQRFATTISTVDQRPGTAGSIAEQQRTLTRFKRAIDSVVRDLRGIDAPSEVTTQHERLVAVMTGFGKDIGEANAAMRNPTPQRIELAKRRLAGVTQSVNARVAAAIAAINAKLRGK